MTIFLIFSAIYLWYIFEIKPTKTSDYNRIQQKWNATNKKISNAAVEKIESLFK